MSGAHSPGPDALWLEWAYSQEDRLQVEMVPGSKWRLRSGAIATVIAQQHVGANRPNVRYRLDRGDAREVHVGPLYRFADAVNVEGEVEG